MDAEKRSDARNGEVARDARKNNPRLSYVILNPPEQDREFGVGSFSGGGTTRFIVVQEQMCRADTYDKWRTMFFLSCCCATSMLCGKMILCPHFFEILVLWEYGIWGICRG